jgi:hypothetical protein
MAAPAPDLTAGRGLAHPDFRPVAVAGFGDGGNSYAHSMLWFRDRLYLGTVRHLLCLLKSSQPRMPHFMEPWPVAYPGDIFTLDLRARIFTYDPVHDTLRDVHVSPVVRGPKGHRVPRDIGYRGMASFRGAGDGAEALYVTTVSSDSRGPGAQVLRSDDGATFTPACEPGLGDPSVSTFRSIVAFHDHLFVTPTGQRQAWNTARAPIVHACRNPAAEPWRPASPSGLGNAGNTVVFEMDTFGDHLYAGTFNAKSGYEIWKTAADGSRLPFRWHRVVDHGAYRGNLNEAATSMCAFNGALYVGSGIQNGGFDRTNGIGPAAAELIRIHPDDSWELVAGTPRETPDGPKAPLSGLGPGFDNPLAGYIWRMEVHEGWLYAGTFDVSVFLPYANRTRLAPWLQRSLRWTGMDELVLGHGGFDLWRTQDGVRWSNVTRTGLGNPFNYGARTLASSPHGLFVGTANPFGPEVAVRVGANWRYVPNDRGGAELWLGA